MLNSKVQELLESLRAKGWDVVCAGGAARDTAIFGIEPKDYDIVLLGSSDAEQATLVAALRSAGCEDIDDYYDEEVAYLADNPGRIEWVVSGSYRGEFFDLIRYTEQPEEIEEQVRMFDCNLNFYWFTSDGEGVAFLPEAYKLGDPIVRFTGCCDTPAQRRDYLAGKFKTLRFPTDGELYLQIKEGI